MRVTDIISVKGAEVVTLAPSATVADLVQTLADRKIGAVVVADGDGIAGIVSERDVVRFVHRSQDLDTVVADIMTTNVITCGPSDEIRVLAEIMTASRFRHLPVVEEGKLVAIVSIGDVVKARLDELQAERDHLEAYVHG